MILLENMSLVERVVIDGTIDTDEEGTTALDVTEDDIEVIGSIDEDRVVEETTMLDDFVPMSKLQAASPVPV